METADSILVSIKKMLGLEADYIHFDTDIILHINTVLSVLTQLGVGPTNGFVITGDEQTWSQFIGQITPERFSMVKSYVYLKVKLIFDPPLSSAAIEAIKTQITELEWRIAVAADPVL